MPLPGGPRGRAPGRQDKNVQAGYPGAPRGPVTARKVRELRVDPNERAKVGVIVTLHQVDYAKTYCDRILALKDGKIVYDGPSDKLSDETLRDIYGAEIEDAYWGESA